MKPTRLRNGKTNVSIIERYWDPARKASRQRTVRGLGLLEDLDREHGDGMAWARGVCDELNAKRAAARQAVPIEIHPDEKIDRRSDNKKNVGSAIPLAYYGMLGIERALRNRARGRRFEYDANAVSRLLVAERIVEPDSKLSAWQNRGSYFFRCDFTDDDVYRSLGFIAGCKDAVISAMNKAIAAHHERNLRDVYYDVTNYYFEIDDEDGLRKRGVSKERRRKPIVQMGMMQDKDGIPINFNVFPGNTSDCLTMLPSMLAARRDVGCGRMVVVADKGLNTSANIAAIVLDGNGFVFSQSIRGTKSPKELKGWAVSPAGWRMSPGDEDGPDFKIKSRQDTKVVHVAGEDGKTRDVGIEVKAVAFWSAKYDRRAKHERARVLEKARALAADPASYDKAVHYGAAKYVKNVAFDKKTGEVLADAAHAPCIDTELIAEEERYDGYYVIITSETGLPDERIVDIYRGLWRIEESFKVTKSVLSARPVFVWTPEHIVAHFLICYIALSILRLIQYDTGHAYSAEAIASEVRQMCGVHLEGNWWRFYHRTDASEALCRAVGIDLSRKNMQLADVKRLLAQAKPASGG
ncbi:MAG: IS1634 family transposase [Clostridiales Family XIII bacterium]|nr:IS1634 family transposase [Clostridiales Family XIII bacterium]